MEMTDTEILDALLALPTTFRGDTRGLREKPAVTQVILSDADGMPLSRRFFNDRMSLIDALREYHAQCVKITQQTGETT